MATFKAVVLKESKRLDNTWRVYIRFTHNRKIRYLATSMYIGKKDITPSYNIKNVNIIDRCNELIKSYRERLYELDLELTEYDIDSVIDYLKKKRDGRGVSFTEFILLWYDKHKDKKGLRNYKTAVNSFLAFMGRDNIYCDEVTTKTMKAFEESLAGLPRARSMYPNAIKTLFNAAREYYNDEDNNIILIKHTLDRYTPIKQNVAKKRALDIDTIRRIFALPYNNKTRHGYTSRHDIALDCFKLSFCLMGTNSADLYNATQLIDNTLIYERTKTKGRRDDNAEIHIDITDYILPLVKKYRGKERAFNFSERYNTMTNFNKMINKGLKEVGKEVGVDGLQFYAARHTLATIAVNDVGISKYIVNDMLNHTDPSLKITELYIRKDYKAINAANKQVLDMVLGKKGSL